MADTRRVRVARRRLPHLVVVPVDGVSWSDWGTPEAVERTLAALRPEETERHLAESSAQMLSPE